MSHDDLMLCSAVSHQLFQAYARRLMQLFAQMGELSGTSSGVSRRHHQSIYVAHDASTAEQPSDRWPYSPADLKAIPADVPSASSVILKPPQRDIAFLQKWQTGAALPLLVLAPFGSGKSILLETFAQTLVNALLDPVAYPLGAMPPPVPLPVRLREWRWHDNEELDAYLWRSQQVLSPNPDGLLSAELLLSLRRAGRLLLMFDGFDELPGKFDSIGELTKSPRAMVLASLRRYSMPLEGKPSPIILTSRPGYEAEDDDLFEDDGRYTLREFTRDDVLRYIRSYFKVPESETKPPSIQTFDNLAPSVADALSRPLLLSAWCREVRRSKGEIPQSVTEIMEVLYLDTFDPQRLRLWLIQPTMQQARFRNQSLGPDYFLRAAPELGAVLYVFAAQRFPERLSRTSLDFELGKILHPYDSDAIDWLLFLLARAGLITPFGNAAFHAPKVPVAEFLIGQYLASLATNDSASKLNFTEIIRRWAWTPELHDTLFFTFDAIARRGDEGAALRDDYVNWLLTLSASCPLSRDSNDRYTYCSRSYDDLLRPLPLLAARLIGPTSEVLDRLVAARWRANRNHPISFIPILRRLKSSAIRPYLQRLTDEWKSADDAQRRAIRFSIEEGAALLPDDEVEPYLIHLIDNIERWTISHKDMADALRAVAENIPPKRARRLIAKCLRLVEASDSLLNDFSLFGGLNITFNHREKLENPREWIAALILPTLVSRIHIADTPQIIEELLSTPRFKNKFFGRCISKAIDGVASRLPPIQARDLVETWLERAFVSSESCIDRHPQFPVAIAAARILPQDAGSAINNWLAKSLVQSTTPEDLILSAVEAASRNVLPKDAEDVIATLNAEGLRTGERRIIAIARRMARKNATISPAELFKQCCELTVAKSAVDSGMIDDEIREIAERLQAQDATNAVDRLLDLVDEGKMVSHLGMRAAIAALQNVTPSDLVRIIPRVSGYGNALVDLKDSQDERLKSAARRVPVNSAIFVLESWFEEGSRAEGILIDNTWNLNRAWYLVVRELSLSIPKCDAYEAIVRWWGEIKILRDKKDMESQYRHSLLKEAFMVAQSRLATNELLSLARRFQAEGELDWSIHAASLARDVAVVVAGFDVDAGRPVYEFRSRSDPSLLLDDERVSHAPDSIRRLIVPSADAQERYVLLRRAVSSPSEGGGRLQLPSWEGADEQIRTLCETVWREVAGIIAVPWALDENGLVSRDDLRTVADKLNLLRSTAAKLIAGLPTTRHDSTNVGIVVPLAKSRAKNSPICKDRIWVCIYEAVGSMSPILAVQCNAAWIALSSGERSKRLRKAFKIQVEPNCPHVLSEPIAAKKKLAVYQGALEKTLAADRPLALALANFVATGSFETPVANFRAHIYRCEKCAAINPPIGTYRICPATCIACNHNLNAVGAIYTRPDVILSCAPCNIEFDVLPPANGWDNKRRKDGLCPKCGKTELAADENRH